MPGSFVAQLTVPVVAVPFQSVIDAPSGWVLPALTVGEGGVTAMVKLPNVTTIGWSPVSGVRIIATLALVPGCTLSVAEPLCVRMLPAS